MGIEMKCIYNTLMQYFSNTLCRSYVPHGPQSVWLRLCPKPQTRCRASPAVYHHHHPRSKHTTPLSTPPQICSPAVSSPAAPAPPRRASKQSPRGVSPRPSRSMRSLLSQSTALTVPMPPRWYVTHGHTGIAGRCRPRDTDNIRREHSTPPPQRPLPSMPSPAPWRASRPLSRRTPSSRRS